MNAVDPATGQDSRTYLVSIRAQRSEFDAIDITRIDPTACVRRFALALRSQIATPAP